MTTLFISDLHLSGQRPEVTQSYIDFIKQWATKADALYILGDLFEYWIGDEAVFQEEFQLALATTRSIVEQGTPVYVMHGNRDFLMGEGFTQAAGCELISDPTVINLYGTRVLLMHGDSLCTDDIEHMAFRKMVRNPAWQKEFLSKTIKERDRTARQYRAYSKLAMNNKRPDIMDVNQETVEKIMREHQVQHLIHGHTHRPGKHEFLLDGKPAQRIVLGDWYDQGSVLHCEPGNWKLDTIPISKSLRKKHKFTRQN